MGEGNGGLYGRFSASFFFCGFFGSFWGEAPRNRIKIYYNIINDLYTFSINLNFIGSGSIRTIKRIGVSTFSEVNPKKFATFLFLIKRTVLPALVVICANA